MADYISILDRAVSALADNSEENRRKIYDKARNALMRQLSSMEPALSPEDISKQRLQLEDAVRDIENRYGAPAETPQAIEDVPAEPEPVEPEPVAPAVMEAPTPEPQAPEPVMAPEPEFAPPPQSEPEPVIAPSEPIEVPAPEPMQAITETNDEVEPAHNQAELAAQQQVDKIVEHPEVVFPQASEATAGEVQPEVSATESAPAVSVDAPAVMPEPTAVEPAPLVAPPVAAPDPISSIDEAEEVLASVHDPDPAPRIRDKPEDPLVELRETMEQDGVTGLDETPLPGDANYSNDKDSLSSIDPVTGFENIASDSVDKVASQTMVVAASKKRGIGKALVGVLVLLVVVATGAFGWSQRDNLAPFYGQLRAQIEALSDAVSQDGEDADNSRSTTPVEVNEDPNKDEDRLLNTPIDESRNEGNSESSEAEPRIQLGQRIELPENTTTTVKQVVPKAESSSSETVAAEVVASPEPVTPAETTPTPSAVTVEETQPEPTTQTEIAIAPPPPTLTTPPANSLFGAKAILLERASGGGRQTATDGSIIWEVVPRGSEAIGATNLPSVRGNADIQGRDIQLRFEILRNLDETLPASHLVELEFSGGTELADDAINNVIGVVLKREQNQNGRQLAGAIAKVSENVFWLAMSNSAADQASNTDALKNLNWIDIVIQFQSGKRATLVLEKGVSGDKAIEKAFSDWQGS